MRVVVLLIGLLLVASPAGAQKRYSDSQLVLAARLGAIMTLIGQCDRDPSVPSASIRRLLREAGLSEADVTGDTRFRARMEEQAKAVRTAAEVSRNVGTSDAEIKRTACRNLVENYGPKGIVIPGVVPAL